MDVEDEYESLHPLVNVFGRRALHNAVRAGHLDVVKYLVKNGARANLKNEVRLDMHNVTHVWT